MEITFSGCGTPEMIECLAQAGILFGRDLFPSRLYPHITIDVIIRSNMREHGMCEPTYFNSSGKPRGFEIELRKKKSIKSMIATLAHEMVHVKQFINEEINDYNMDWKGKRVNIRKLDYYDLPWEAEAFGSEKRLMELYKNNFQIPSSSPSE